MLVFEYNNNLYPTWDECVLNFPKGMFDKYECLDNHLLAKYGINMVNVNDDFKETDDIKMVRMKTIRNNMLLNSDHYLLKDYPIEQLRLDSIIQWRQYLRDYTKQDKWYEKRPLTLDEFNNETENLYE